MIACPVVVLAMAALASGFGGQAVMGSLRYNSDYDSGGVQTPYNIFELLNPLRIFRRLVASIKFYYHGVIPSFLWRVLTSLKNLISVLNQHGQRYFSWYAPQSAYPPVPVDQTLQLSQSVPATGPVPPYNYSWSTLLGSYLSRLGYSSQKSGYISGTSRYLSHPSGSRPLNIGKKSLSLVDRSLKSGHPSKNRGNPPQHSHNLSQKGAHVSEISGHLSHQRGNQSQKSAHRSQKSAHQLQKSAHRSQKSAHQLQKSAHRSQKSAARSQKSAHQLQKSAHRSQKSAARSQKSAHQLQKSAHRSQKNGHKLPRVTSKRLTSPKNYSYPADIEKGKLKIVEVE